MRDVNGSYDTDHCSPIKLPKGLLGVGSEGSNASNASCLFEYWLYRRPPVCLAYHVAYGRIGLLCPRSACVSSPGEVQSRVNLLGMSSRVQMPMSCDLDAGTRLLVAFGCNRAFRGDSLFLMPSRGVLCTGSESYTCDLV